MTTMQAWCDQWKTIYLASETDKLDAYENEGITYYHFGYDAPQGRFEFHVPASRCDLLQTDSTVERIAEHIASAIKGKFPDDSIRIKAYEGVNKGAIAEM